MGTSNSSPVRFIGQSPLPEFDYSQQPLPDNMRVLLWMLDGAERRHHLARSWRAPDDLHVEVEGGEVMVTLPGTRYAVTYYVTYYKTANSPQLRGKNFPEEVDRRSPISQAAFVGKAWKLANDKARELGWIV
jgi:hypothetical protein